MGGGDIYNSQVFSVVLPPLEILDALWLICFSKGENSLRERC